MSDYTGIRDACANQDIELGSSRMDRRVPELGFLIVVSYADISSRSRQVFGSSSIISSALGAGQGAPWSCAPAMSVSCNLSLVSSVMAQIHGPRLSIQHFLSPMIFNFSSASAHPSFVASKHYDTPPNPTHPHSTSAPTPTAHTAVSHSPWRQPSASSYTALHPWPHFSAYTSPPTPSPSANTPPPNFFSSSIPPLSAYPAPRTHSSSYISTPVHTWCMARTVRTSRGCLCVGLGAWRSGWVRSRLDRRTFRSRRSY